MALKYGQQYIAGFMPADNPKLDLYGATKGVMSLYGNKGSSPSTSSSTKNKDADAGNQQINVSGTAGNTTEMIKYMSGLDKMIAIKENEFTKNVRDNFGEYAGSEKEATLLSEIQQLHIAKDNALRSLPDVSQHGTEWAETKKSIDANQIGNQHTLFVDGNGELKYDFFNRKTNDQTMNDIYQTSTIEYNPDGSVKAGRVMFPILSKKGSYNNRVRYDFTLISGKKSTSGKSGFGIEEDPKIKETALAYTYHSSGGSNVNNLINGIAAVNASLTQEEIADGIQGSITSINQNVNNIENYAKDKDFMTFTDPEKFNELSTKEKQIILDNYTATGNVYELRGLRELADIQTDVTTYTTLAEKKAIELKKQNYSDEEIMDAIGKDEELNKIKSNIQNKKEGVNSLFNFAAKADLYNKTQSYALSLKEIDSNRTIANLRDYYKNGNGGYSKDKQPQLTKFEEYAIDVNRLITESNGRVAQIKIGGKHISAPVSAVEGSWIFPYIKEYGVKLLAKADDIGYMSGTGAKVNLNALKTFGATIIDTEQESVGLTYDANTKNIHSLTGEEQKAHQQIFGIVQTAAKRYTKPDKNGNIKVNLKDIETFYREQNVPKGDRLITAQTVENMTGGAIDSQGNITINPNKIYNNNNQTLQQEAFTEVKILIPEIDINDMTQQEKMQLVQLAQVYGIDIDHKLTGPNRFGQTSYLDHKVEEIISKMEIEKDDDGIPIGVSFRMFVSNKITAESVTDMAKKTQLNVVEKNNAQNIAAGLNY